MNPFAAILSVAGIAMFSALTANAETSVPPNVLFISIEDLNDWEGDKLDKRVNAWMESNSVPSWLR